MKRLVLLPAVLSLIGCYIPFRPPMNQVEAWRWTETNRAQRYLDEHAISTLRPDEEAGDECEFLGPIYAGPGIGVANEQRNVLIVGALMGATHVQWEDVETAHFYRCPERGEQ